MASHSPSSLSPTLSSLSIDNNPHPQHNVNANHPQSINDVRNSKSPSPSPPSSTPSLTHHEVSSSPSSFSSSPSSLNETEIQTNDKIENILIPSASLPSSSLPSSSSSAPLPLLSLNDFLLFPKCKFSSEVNGKKEFKGKNCLITKPPNESKESAEESNVWMSGPCVALNVPLSLSPSSPRSFPRCHWILMKFTSPVTLHNGVITVQGGFGAEVMSIFSGNSSSSSSSSSSSYLFQSDFPLLDANVPQHFSFFSPFSSDKILFVFHSLCDQFGRISIQKIHLLGKRGNDT